MPLLLSLVDIGVLRYIARIVRDDAVYRELGRAIAKRRNDAGLTQDRFARICGFSRASLANIESGLQNVYVHQLIAIADALGENSIDGLIHGTNRTARSAWAGPANWCSPDPLTEGEQRQIYMIYSSAGKPVVTEVET